MPRSVPELLEDILTYSSRCRRLAGNKAYLAYVNDEQFRYATERCIGVIGEAMSQVLKQDLAILQAVPDAKKIVALRHRLAHNYYDIYDAIIWTTVQEYLEPLEREVQAFLQDYEGVRTRDE